MIGKTILMLMDAHGMSVKETADSAGVSSETLKNIIYEKVKNPGVLTLNAIAKVFGVSINFLIGEPFISPEESALLENYRRSGNRGKSVIELIAKYEATAARSERNAKGKHSIPCVVPKGNIRKGIVYDTNETIEISTVVDEAYMAITITNNDMVPMFCKGDRILFEKRFPENGETVAFIISDRVYIRKFAEENGRYTMKCLHNHGEDMVFKRMDEIILVGTCCGVIRD